MPVLVIPLFDVTKYHDTERRLEVLMQCQQVSRVLCIIWQVAVHSAAAIDANRDKTRVHWPDLCLGPQKLITTVPACGPDLTAPVD